MNEPIWLTAAQAKMLHAESLNRFGGLPGLRDERLLESALARPQHQYAYGETPSLFSLAAAYGFGVARNHPFLDGNKRTALLCMRTFLFRNGYHFVPDPAETVVFIEGLAAGDVTEAQLTAWIKANATLRERQ